MFHSMFGPRFLFEAGAGGGAGTGGSSDSTSQGAGAGGADGGGAGEHTPDPTAAEKARAELLKLKPEELADKLLAEQVETSRVSHESAQRKAELKKRDEADAKRKKEELTEAERLKVENDELKAARLQDAAKVKRATISSAVRLAATKQGFADPADAERFISHDALPYDAEKDEVDGKAIETALKKLGTEKPYLLAKTVDKPDLDGDKRPTKEQQEAEKTRIASEFGLDHQPSK